MLLWTFKVGTDIYYSLITPFVHAQLYRVLTFGGSYFLLNEGGSVTIVSILMPFLLEMCNLGCILMATDQLINPSVHFYQSLYAS